MCIASTCGPFGGAFHMQDAIWERRSSRPSYPKTLLCRRGVALLYFIASFLLAAMLTLGDYDTFSRDLIFGVLNLPEVEIVESRILPTFITHDPLLPAVVVAAVDALIGGLFAIFLWTTNIRPGGRGSDTTTAQQN